jgi:hypothetical protein
MMKKLKYIVLIVMILPTVISFGSCLNSELIDITPITTSMITVEPSTTTTSNVVTPSTSIPLDKRLMDVDWVSPSKVEVSNFHNGATAENSEKIHNGSEKTKTYKVEYRIPDNTLEGYDMPPKEAVNWVTIADGSPTISSKESIQDLISLTMPKDFVLKSGKWEFWISISEEGQGTIQTEMCTRWLITMR